MVERGLGVWVIGLEKPIRGCMFGADLARIDGLLMGRSKTEWGFDPGGELTKGVFEKIEQWIEGRHMPVLGTSCVTYVQLSSSLAGSKLY
jgi:hypothetical protein